MAAMARAQGLDPAAMTVRDAADLVDYLAASSRERTDAWQPCPRLVAGRLWEDGSMPEMEVRTKITVEGDAESKRKAAGVKDEIKGLGPAGQQAAQGVAALGGAFSAVGQILGPGGAVLGGIALGKKMI